MQVWLNPARSAPNRIQPAISVTYLRLITRPDWLVKLKASNQARLPRTLRDPRARRYLTGQAPADRQVFE